MLRRRNGCGETDILVNAVTHHLDLKLFADKYLTIQYAAPGGERGYTDHCPPVRTKYLL
ncbi:MAG: hypothetical protein WBA41_15330 [Rivularia sp. (in: cyanobacteria)]